VLEAIGVKIVHGSASDRDLINKQLTEHHYDAVINCADADDLELVSAILGALKKRKEATGKESVYLHTR
jgi:NADPH-dependent glutamate synthase beta subunit-like oxidoreductase